MEENKHFDKKSLRFINGRNTDWDELAKDCVCFANALGGSILIGIEKDADIPPVGQLILDKNLPDKIVRAINNRTYNVAVSAYIKTASNNAEFIELEVKRNTKTIASTTDGRYYIRDSDDCKPIPPDEMSRLAADRDAYFWEVQTTKRVPESNYDKSKLDSFLSDIRSSSRVSNFIKEKSVDEILDHYFFVKDKFLTNLGILWIGNRSDRAGLLFAPAIQVIRYNERDEKIWKLTLDDYSYNPKELIEIVLAKVPDWQDTIEISDGLFRKTFPYYPIDVIRELVVNALVHRPYTTRGDIYINLYHDRLEIHNPGLLPYGVTPSNILTKSVRRNEQLSRVFYDLILMEKEGSGYDLIYELLLGSGKLLPLVTQGDDRVVVTIPKQFISKEIVKIMDRANQEYQLKQKEIITLGLIAQHTSLSAVELSKLLNQNDSKGLTPWLGRLPNIKLVLTKGIKKATEYYINPDFYRKINYKGKTDLKIIEPHRLQELIYQDVNKYPGSAISEIHLRIGIEIPIRKVKNELDKLIADDKVISKGVKRWTRYSINKNT